MDLRLHRDDKTSSEAVAGTDPIRPPRLLWQLAHARRLHGWQGRLPQDTRQERRRRQPRKQGGLQSQRD